MTSPPWTSTHTPQLPVIVTRTAYKDHRDQDVAFATRGAGGATPQLPWSMMHSPLTMHHKHGDPRHCTAKSSKSSVLGTCREELFQDITPSDEA